MAQCSQSPSFSLIIIGRRGSRWSGPSPSYSQFFFFHTDSCVQWHHVSSSAAVLPKARLSHYSWEALARMHNFGRFSDTYRLWFTACSCLRAPLLGDYSALWYLLWLMSVWWVAWGLLVAECSAPRAMSESLWADSLSLHSMTTMEVNLQSSSYAARLGHVFVLQIHSSVASEALLGQAGSTAVLGCGWPRWHLFVALFFKYACYLITTTTDSLVK